MMKSTEQDDKRRSDQYLSSIKPCVQVVRVEMPRTENENLKGLLRRRDLFANI